MPAVGLFTLAPVATIASAGALTAAALYAALDAVAFGVGRTWVGGWVMWRKPATTTAARERGRWHLNRTTGKLRRHESGSGAAVMGGGVQVVGGGRASGGVPFWDAGAPRGRRQA